MLRIVSIAVVARGALDDDHFAGVLRAKEALRTPPALAFVAGEHFECTFAELSAKYWSSSKGLPVPEYKGDLLVPPQCCIETNKLTVEITYSSDVHANRKKTIAFESDARSKPKYCLGK